jgi:hypothetical protein
MDWFLVSDEAGKDRLGNDIIDIKNKVLFDI